MKKNQHTNKISEIAGMLDVPKVLVSCVRQIKYERPDLIEHIQAREISIDAALKIIKEAGEVVIIPINDARESVIRLADVYDIENKAICCCITKNNIREL